MTNESRFMRELRLRQSRLNHRRRLESTSQNTSRTFGHSKGSRRDCYRDDEELRIMDSKIMALCNEVDSDMKQEGNQEAAITTSSSTSRLQQATRAVARVETRDEYDQNTRDGEEDDVDFIQEIAESIMAQPSTLFCEELVGSTGHIVADSLLRHNPNYIVARDELDDLLDEALRDDQEEDNDDILEEPDEASSSSSASCYSFASISASASSSAGSSILGDADRSPNDDGLLSVCSSIDSQELRLLLSESGLSANKYQIASFYTFPSDSGASPEGCSNVNAPPSPASPAQPFFMISPLSTASRPHWHRTIALGHQWHHRQLLPTPTPRVDSSAHSESLGSHPRRRMQDSEDEDEEEYEEYEYFPEPSVVDMLPGLNAALDALAERFSCGPCGREEEESVVVMEPVPKSEGRGDATPQGREGESNQVAAA